MNNNTKWSHLQSEMEQLHGQGLGPTAIAKALIDRHKLDIDPEHLRGVVKYRIGRLRDLEQYKTEAIKTDKPIAEFNWREALKPVQELQQIFKRASSGQDYATWQIQTDQPICVVVIGDTQLGSWATDYELFKEVTDEIINTPNLYVILVGDILQMAIKMRGVLEVMDNALPPKFQLMFLDSWLSEIKHKVIAATWDNHSVMREEDAVGYSSYAEIFRRHTIYHNHIGHLDVQVNDIVYKFAVSHFFMGRSELNPCHAPMKYMRYKGQDRDIAVQGDFHVPGKIRYYEGGKERIAMVCGSIQTDSGYAKRFFNLTTHPIYPCVVLHHDRKMMTDYWSVKEWLAASKISI